MKYNLAILKSESAFEHELWVKACQENPNVQSADIIELTSDSWFISINKKNYDLFLLRPPGRTELFKRLYDERIYIISKIMGKKIYPSYDEIFIYENKRVLRDYMLASKIPHPATSSFFSVKEALQFSERTKFPIVAKTNIGASGSGISFIQNKEEIESYIKQAFSSGIKRISGPKLTKGSISKKIRKAIFKRGFIKNRLSEYKTTSNETQSGFVIFQEFVPHTYEWRCVRIGNSYFAHKKIAVDNKSSGTLIKGYDPVPFSLLDFIEEITEKNNLRSVSVDVFEKEGNYLVNEIQCFFGQSDPYQMLVEGKPGRYIRLKGDWEFEEGDFNNNESFSLRLDHAIELLDEKNSQKHL
jgi:glutathione synthase/RimK-type ligase-like ATP-grasp enzyme